jgi:hypothetical protein
MVQICCNISEQEYNEILKQAEELGISKGRRAADIITYALNVDQEIAHKDELITQLREDVGFLRSEIMTSLQPLTKLLPETTETKKSRWHFFRRS